MAKVDVIHKIPSSVLMNVCILDEASISHKSKFSAQDGLY